MIFYAVKLLNYFPVKGGVSDTLSPKAILSGEVVHYKYYSMPFGTYCQIHEEDGLRKSMAARMQGANSLEPSGNTQGGQKFLTLNTGRVVTRQSWDILPMPSNVIAHVNQLGNSQPTVLSFHNHTGNDIFDIADSTPIISQPYPPSDEYDVPGVVENTHEIPGVDEEDTEILEVDNDNGNDVKIAPPPNNEAHNDDVPNIPPIESNLTIQNSNYAVHPGRDTLPINISHR